MTITVGVIGSTGSIGTQTLDAIGDDADRYRVVALAAGSNVAALIAQARAVKPDYVAIGNETLAAEVADAIPARTKLLSGPSALAEIAEIADVTVNGVVGFAGLPVTLSCLKAGKRLALANKESLIAAGPVVQPLRHTPGAELVPVDSEHVAIHQCLRANDEGRRVSRLHLTASGGPFRGRSADDLASVTIEDALAHPTWSMGPKITIDSSTLMNKGLEVIEANELFGRPAGSVGFDLSFDEIDVVVHPQSIIHSMVTYSDGSTIAQLSNPDMRLPIGYALAYPDRFPVPYGQIDWTELSRLDFEAPDLQAFPCLQLAYVAGRAGGTAPATLSAANEVAVDAFLRSAIRWIDIPTVIERVLSGQEPGTAATLEEVLAADADARRRATAVVEELSRKGR